MMLFKFWDVLRVALLVGLLSCGRADAVEFMLTFDDGPVPGATDRVLNALDGIRAEDGLPVRAGFFLVGAAPEQVWSRRKHYAPYELWGEKGKLAAHPQLVRRIVSAGHWVGNHSAHHSWFRWPWLSDVEAVREEIAGWDRLASSALTDPAAPRLFRPPYLVDTPEVRRAAEEAGYRVVLGVSSGDAAPLATPYSIVERLVGILRKWDQDVPCVLIFHDTRPSTQESLAEIVSALRERGFMLAHFDPERIR